MIEDLCRVDGVLVIAAHPRARGARCGRCGRVSTRVHSSYQRRLADLPVAGYPTELRLRVRRFFCDQNDCSAGTFVEQVPGLTERHGQRTAGLQDALLAVALALAGRAGSRLATALGMPVSRSTLLRRIRGLPDPPVGAVTVLGVDEFGWRRGRDYGTVLVDLDHGNRPVDILYGRDAGDVADWLREHPGVKMICRDRASGYADGARQGAPDARQVADRRHLCDNLCQQVNKVVAAHHTCLVEPVPVAAMCADDGEHGSGEPAGLTALNQLRTTRSERTRWRFLEIHVLHVQGLSRPIISRRLGLDIKTVRRYLRADNAEQLVAGGVRTSKLDPFKPYLRQRLAAGGRNATALSAEIVAQGYTGSYLRPRALSQAAAAAGTRPPWARSCGTGRRRCGRSPPGSPACPATSMPLMRRG